METILNTTKVFKGLIPGITLMMILVSSTSPVAAQVTEQACLPPDANPSDQITEYTIPTANSEPWGITAGPDGALWFGEGANIGRIAIDGTFSEYPLLVAHTDLHFDPTASEGLTSGPDGAIWFTDDIQNKIGRITTDGEITEYAIPSGIETQDLNYLTYTTSLPRGLVVGADNALWFTERLTHKIGRITADGEITEYPTPTLGSGPLGIALGSDSALWFTEQGRKQIGRITTDGEITEYPLPNPDGDGGPGVRIAAGSDGALWFTEYNPPMIGRITTDGEITEFALCPGTGPVGVTAGSDNAIWFTEYNGNRIGRITMAGEITEYVIPTPRSHPFSIVTGSDGALWFTEIGSSKIGRLQP